MILAFFLDHWWQYNFWPLHEAWYRGAAWPNVAAVLPLGILGAAGFLYHHFALKRLHESHDQHLKAILNALDPEINTDTQIDRIAELVDDTKPGGITVAIEELRKKD